MTNPYTVTARGNETTEPRSPDSKGRMLIRWIVAGLSIFAIVAFLLIAFVLLMQAMRLTSDAASLPPNLQAKIQKTGDSTIRASWIGGVTAIGGAIANVIAIVMIRRRKTFLPLAVFAVSVACLLAITVLFKPV